MSDRTYLSEITGKWYVDKDDAFGDEFFEACIRSGVISLEPDPEFNEEMAKRMDAIRFRSEEPEEEWDC